MTMELQIGLVGYAMAGTGRPIDGSLHQAGDDFSLDAEYRLDNAADAAAIRQQVLGYIETGYQPVLPLVWTRDSTFDGYYRLVGASVDTDTALYLGGRVIARYKLERIQSYSAPAVESVLKGAKRSFAAGFNGLDKPWIGYPTTWSAFDIQTAGISIFTTTDHRNLTPTLAMWLASYPATFYDAVILQGAPPANFYDGAVFLRTGTSLLPHTGRQVVSEPTHWEVDNGLIKVTQSNRNTSMFDLVVRKADGSGWSPRARGLVVRYAYAGSTGIEWGASAPGGANVEHTPQRVTVVKNTPEEVVVCLTFATASIALPGAMGILRVFLGVRRGSRFVSVTVASSASELWGLGYDAAAGFSGVGVNFKNVGGTNNVGVKEPAHDAYGQRSFVMRGSANMTLGTTGQAYLTVTATTAEWGVGALPGGSDPSDVDEEIAAQFLAAQGETMRVVGQ